MPMLPIEQLGERDTVLVEAHIGRFKTKATSLNENERQWGWVTWKAFLELKSISLLHNAPSIAQESEDGEYISSSDIRI
jgi:hypothetical protein